MTARTKIDVHAETLSMEFVDTFMEFNIFEALKHPAEDHSIFNMDTIEELVEEYVRMDVGSANLFDFIYDILNCFYTMEAKAVNKKSNLTRIKESQQAEAESNFGQSSPYLDRIDQPTPSIEKDVSPQPSNTELKPLPEHLKYAYLGEHQCPTNKAKQRRLNLTILDVVKKEVTKLLATGIIYPISDNQWVSPIQVLPKKSGITIIKNRKLNQVTHKDHFLLPFIHQVLEKLAGKSHFCFLDGFSSYMQIHIAPVDQHKTTFTCPFDTFVYTRMLFGLCNAPSSF
ncbi:hypothetical protein CR513_25965, partial [Mucuna pruriens]